MFYLIRNASRFIITNLRSKSMDYIVFFLLIIFFGSFSLARGQDFNWDFKQYHFYNGWAYLNNRLLKDMTPNNAFQGYFSPVLDALEYLTITHVHIKMYAFILGAISGVNAFLCYKINKLIFIQNCSVRLRYFYIFIATILSTTGCANLSQVGTSMNENIVILFVIFGVYSIFLYYNKMNRVNIIFAGLMLGAAVGLKLTFFTSVLSIALIFILQNIKSPKILLGFLIRSCIGFILIDGQWMFEMYRLFENPIYPNFSKLINGSTSIYYINWTKDNTFIPKDFMHWVFMPFYLMKDNTLTSEFPMRDFRFGCAFICILYHLIMLLKHSGKINYNKSIVFCYMVFVLTYVLWLIVFSIQRYTIFIECMAGIIIVHSISQIKICNKYKAYSLLILCFILVSTTKLTDHGHTSFKNEILEINFRAEDSLFIFNQDTTAYLAPLIGTTNIYINSPPYNYTSKYAFEKKDYLLKKYIYENKSVYIVNTSQRHKNDPKWLKQYNLTIDWNTCNILALQKISICKLIQVF